MTLQNGWQIARRALVLIPIVLWHFTAVVLWSRKEEEACLLRYMCQEDPSPSQHLLSFYGSAGVDEWVEFHSYATICVLLIGLATFGILCLGYWIVKGRSPFFTGFITCQDQSCTCKLHEEATFVTEWQNPAGQTITLSEEACFDSSCKCATHENETFAKEWQHPS